MNRKEFRTKNQPMVAVFFTTRDIKTPTWNWSLSDYEGEDEYADEEVWEIPKNTLVVSTQLMNRDHMDFGDGTSVRPVHPDLFGEIFRWFRCDYDDLEFQSYVPVNDLINE